MARRTRVFNAPALKGDLGDLILETFKALGKDETIEALDRLKEMGFDMATRLEFIGILT